MTLAIPSVARMLLQTVVGIVALMIVGRLNAESIAAVGLGNRLFFLAIGVLSAITVGTTAVIAHAIGAQDLEHAQRATIQSLVLAVLIGVVVAVGGILTAEPLMRLMMLFQEEVDMEVVQLGTTYLQLLWGSMVIGNLLFAGNAVLQGAGDMKTPMYVMGVVNISNAVLSYLLVFGVGPFPHLGVAGAGWAGALSRVIGGVLVTWFLLSSRSPIPLPRNISFRLDWPTVRGILDIGLPAAGENMVRQASQIIYTMLIAGLGTLAIAANQIAQSVQSLSFMPGFGFGMAATALVGQNLGAGKTRRAEDVGWESLRLSLVICTAMGVVFFVFPSPLLRLYTANSEVVRLGVGPLRVVAFSQPFLAAVMVLAGGLRGAGDTRYVLYLTTLGNWGVRLLFSYILGFVLGMGLLGVWIAMAMDQVIRGILVTFRFRSGKWKNIVIDRPGGAPTGGSRAPRAAGGAAAHPTAPSGTRGPQSE